MSNTTIADIAANIPKYIERLRAENAALQAELSKNPDMTHEECMHISVVRERTAVEIANAFLAASPEEVSDNLFVLAELIDDLKPYQRLPLFMDDRRPGAHAVLTMHASGYRYGRMNTDDLAEKGIKIPDGTPFEHPLASQVPAKHKLEVSSPAQAPAMKLS